MSLDQFQLLAYAAGFGAVSEEAEDLQSAVPPDDSRALMRIRNDFIPGRHMPDAPAPRTMMVTREPSRALAIVEPLWGAGMAKAAPSWAQHLASAARSVSAYIPGRGVPA